MAYLNPQEAFEHFKERVLEGIGQSFPVKGRLQTLHLDRLEVVDNLHPDDIKAQHEARVSGKSFAVPVYAHLTLKENDTGKVLDSKRVRVAEIPKMTRRYSYLQSGPYGTQEYQIQNQWQLKPGIYTRRRQNGDLEARFNVSGRSAFDLLFDPASKQFVMALNADKSKVPLYPLLKTLGVDDDTLERTWGRDIFVANKNARGVATAVEKFYKSDRKTDAPSRAEAEKHLVETMQQAVVRPEATALTLGKPFDHVTGEALLLATDKMKKVQAGHPEDDRDSLIFKDLRTAGDFAFETSYASRSSSADCSQARTQDQRREGRRETS
jgi:DNA-directed RNA polymerase beta subunit